MDVPYFASVAVSTPTLSELRAKLEQLLIQEDRLLAKYKCVHESYHISQRKARTGDDSQNHMMGLKERLVGARMKVLGMDLRDVAGRRRELLKKLEKAEAATKLNRRAQKVMKTGVGPEEAEAATAP